MNQITLPTPDTIPVHWFWFEVLLILTFFIHMILVNFILGGSLLTIWDIVRGKQEIKASRNIPIIVALTINFGVPPLLFVQVLYGQFFYSSSVIMAVPWILVIPVLIVAYYGAYMYSKKIEKAPKWSKVGLVISTLMMLYVAFMYVNNSTLALSQNRWDVYFANMSGLNFNWSEPTLVSRYLHFILATIAIAALGRAIYYHYLKISEEDKKSHIKKNLKIFGWVTALQFVIGTWFLLTMPESVWKQFMVEATWPTITMIFTWFAAIGILFSAFTYRLRLSIFFGALQILLMVIIREMSRFAYLKADFHPSNLENIDKTSSLNMFIFVFLVGIYLVYFMIKLMLKSKKSEL